MTYILHLETATKACSVALSLNGEQVALSEVNTTEYSHAENLTVFVQNVLTEAQISLTDLAAVSVSSGPGSYTGLRIGVSTAKGFCYALSIPLIAVDALYSLAQQALLRHPGKNLCAMIDARRMEVFSAIYTGPLQLIKPISADIIDETSYSEFGSFVYFGDGAEKLKNCWEQRDMQADLTIFSSAIGQIKEAYRKFTVQEFEDVAYFEPFYLKDFVSK
jgi:tRNA threonylcarbamoyladenosine biosynthesis protein TsaB